MVPPLHTSPAGLLDFYLLNPLARLLQRRFTERDFTLRDRLGGGNYGQGAGAGGWRWCCRRRCCCALPLRLESVLAIKQYALPTNRHTAAVFEGLINAIQPF